MSAYCEKLLVICPEFDIPPIGGCIMHLGTGFYKPSLPASPEAELMETGVIHPFISLVLFFRLHPKLN